MYIESKEDEVARLQVIDEQDSFEVVNDTTCEGIDFDINCTEGFTARSVEANEMIDQDDEPAGSA